MSVDQAIGATDKVERPTDRLHEATDKLSDPTDKGRTATDKLVFPVRRRADRPTGPGAGPPVPAPQIP